MYSRICFALQSTPSGQRAVETLFTGDAVIGFNLQTQRKEIGIVEKQRVHTTNEFYLLNNSLKVTGGHPLAVSENGDIVWKKVRELKQGNWLISLSGGQVGVEQIETIQSDILIKVYNPQISINTYYVVINNVPILVHNKQYMPPDNTLNSKFAFTLIIFIVLIVTALLIAGVILIVHKQKKQVTKPPSEEPSQAPPPSQENGTPSTTS